MNPRKASKAKPNLRPVFQLRPLGNTALKVHAILWLTIALLAVAAMGIGNYRTWVRLSNAPFSHLGLAWHENNGMIRLTDPTSDEAWNSGIRDGDVILAVDGKRVGSDLASAAAIDRLLIRPEGATATLSTRSKAGKVSNHRLTRLESHLDEQFAGSGISSRYFLAITLLTDILPDLILFITGVVLFVRGRRREAVPATLAIALTLLAATGPGTYYFYVSMPLARGVLGAIAISLLIAAIAAFPQGRYDPPWTRFAALGALVLGGVAPFALGSAWLDVGWTLLLVLALGAVMHRYRRLASGAARQQIRWVLFGFACGTLLLCLTSATAPFINRLPWRSVERLWADLGIQVLAGAGFVCMAVGLLVSLLRYRLYDADAVISRSIAYVGVTLSVLAIFAGSEKLIEILGQEYLGNGLGVLAGGVGAALAAGMIAPLHHRVGHWAERRFRGDLLRLRRNLPVLVGDLRETAPIETVSAAIVDAIEDGVRSCRTALVVSDELTAARGVKPEEFETWRIRWMPPVHDGLDCDATDALFPVRLPLDADGHGRLGWLLLGPRPDGSLYGKDEREALIEVADPVARGLQIVSLRQAREAANERRFALLADRLDALEGRR